MYFLNSLKLLGNLLEPFAKAIVLVSSGTCANIWSKVFNIIFLENADNIIVLKNGKIVEQGTHKELVEMKNEYFNLVKNQLELGN